ncbi:MAG: S1C family serine protease [Acutalibacteraceae bacterium]
MSEEFENISGGNENGNFTEAPEQPIEPQISEEVIGQGDCAASDNAVDTADVVGSADNGDTVNNVSVAGNADTAEENYQDKPQTNGGCYNQTERFSDTVNQGGYAQNNYAQGGYGQADYAQGGFQPEKQPYAAGGSNINSMCPPGVLPQNPYAQAGQGIPPQYGTVNFSPYPREKKSVSSGLVIFLVTALIVLTMCICLTVVAVSKSPSGRRYTDDILDNYQLPTSGYEYGTQAPTKDDNALDKSDLTDTTDKNGQQISLNNQPADILENGKYTAKYAYDKAKDSVVGIVGYQEKEKTKIGSQGTGIVISENGYIVTNSHVIGDSKTKYKVVVLIDGQEYDAQVTGYDSRTDIAVLKIDKTGLTPADFADSGEVSVGQEVVAIGNPGGINFSNSLTQGIVSALDRDVSHGNVSYIQTDAAINPGNSGGPLLNMSGQVIGITTVKIVNTSYEGMGFAIPSQQAVSVIDSIIKQGYVEGRVRIGLTGNEITSAYSSYYGMPIGIYVVTVDEKGPLADGDIEPGDIVTKIDDVDITSFSVLYKELDKHKAGDVVTLTYQRPNDDETEYTEHTQRVTLAADSAAE